MLCETLARHLQRVAALYPGISPGRPLTAPKAQKGTEADLFSEISGARNALRTATAAFPSPRPLVVATGEPKGAWAHVYYVSFHDPVSSRSPTEGFYPVFLLSTDQKIVWLSVALAAGSVGVSGRGGWSQKRGVSRRGAVGHRRLAQGTCRTWREFGLYASRDRQRPGRRTRV